MTSFHYLTCMKSFNPSKDKQAVGIVPIENSIEGTINIVADSLAHHDVYAHGEIQLDIDFSLYGHHSNSLDDIHKVYSIAQQSVKQ